MSEQDERRYWIRYYTVGAEFAITFLLGLGAGVWLDHLHGPPPAYTLTLGAIGFGVALYRLLRQAFALKRKEDRKAKDKAAEAAKAREERRRHKSGDSQ